MIDELKIITLGRENYPYICTIGSLEKLQLKYGSIYRWNSAMLKIEGEEKSIGFTPDVVLDTLYLFLKEGQAVNEMMNGIKKECPEKERLSLLLAMSNIGLMDVGKLLIRAVDDCIDPNCHTPKEETGKTENAK